MTRAPSPRLTLPPSEVLGAVAPLVVFVALLGGAALLYALRNHGRAHFHDEEMDQRGAGGLSTRSLRHFFAWVMRPLWQGLASVGFPPDAITKLSLAIALGAAVAVAAGRFALGGWLFLGSGLLDFLDGRVARATQNASRRGAALDSVLDRYVEAAFLTGLCWYYRTDWVLAAGLFALSGSLLVPYVRARGEALDVKVDDVGFMQRTERVVLLGLGTALSPAVDALIAPRAAHPRQYLALVALIVLALTSHVSAAQRLGRVLEALGHRATRADRSRPLKSMIANAVATLVDFSVASTLFFLTGLHGWAATGAGCVAGAFVSFTLLRRWAFEARAGSAQLQFDRYVLVSAATAALNGGGVALLSLLVVPFPIGWALTRAVVFACFSYPVQRDFVFRTSTVRRAAPSVAPGEFTPPGAARAQASAPR